MEKAILIIDMPQNCAECDFSECRKDQDWGDGDYCTINGGQCLNCKRPEWCPLRELPEKKPEVEIRKCKGSTKGTWKVPLLENVGWNACINKILV